MIITIFGVDGSGKTTQAKLLTERLSELGYDCICTNPIYYLLKLMKMDSNDFLISPRKMRISRIKTDDNLSFSLFLLGYFYALLSIIAIKIKSAGRIVVCDRFFFQFFYDIGGAKGEWLVSLIPKPDLTFHLTGYWKVFRDRIQDEFDATVDDEYYISVMNFLNNLRERYSFVEVDATHDINQTSNSIWGKVKQHLDIE